MKSLISDIIELEYRDDQCLRDIDDVLTFRYGSVLRWAIVDISCNKLKICFTYEKGV